MNKILKGMVSCIFVLILSSCMTVQFECAPPGSLPTNFPDRDITKSPYYGKLVSSYGEGKIYEQTKIMYLLNETRNSPFRFWRNGSTYKAGTTADHLFKKYRRRTDRIHTAQDFIDHVASISTRSGNPYRALPGDGFAYQTGDILQHGLDRHDAFMAEKHGDSIHPIQQRMQETTDLAS